MEDDWMYRDHDQIQKVTGVREKDAQYLKFEVTMLSIEKVEQLLKDQETKFQMELAGLRSKVEAHSSELAQLKGQLANADKQLCIVTEKAALAEKEATEAKERAQKAEAKAVEAEAKAVEAQKYADLQLCIVTEKAALAVKEATEAKERAEKAEAKAVEAQKMVEELEDQLSQALTDLDNAKNEILRLNNLNTDLFMQLDDLLSREARERVQLEQQEAEMSRARRNTQQYEDEEEESQIITQIDEILIENRHQESINQSEL